MLAVALLVSLHVIWQAWLVASAPYPAHYDFDEGVYAETAAAAAAGNRLYEAVFLSQPPLLVGLLAHAFGTFGRSLASARGVVAGFSVLWLACLAAIAARGSRPRPALWAVAIAGSAPAFVTASHTIQMEGPSEALAALAVSLGLTADGGPGRTSRGDLGDSQRWGAAGLAAGLALMTKFTAVTCLVPLAMAVLAADRTVSPKRLAARIAALAAGALLAAAAAVIWTGGQPAAMWQQAVAFHGAVARAMGADPGRTAALLLDFAAANWFLVALGLAGVAGAAAGGRPAGAVTAWLAADVAAVFLWRPVWTHHLVIFVTPLAVLGAAAVETIWRGTERAGDAPPHPVRTAAPRLAAGTLLLCWLAALAGTVAAVMPERSGSLQAAAARTAQSVPAGSWIVADDPMVAFLAGRDVPPALCDISEMRMRSGWLTAGDLTAALADPRVQGVVLWRGTFRRFFPEVPAAASKEFPRRWTTADGREILTR
ncbi:MAG TPA: glycosyltransferase family 39 protein [bacterium]|nr:glycosyltransferase family 39 protein [bacterium]